MKGTQQLLNTAIPDPYFKLKNFNVAIPTAFHKNEEINEQATLAHIQSLQAQGVDSFLVCGSTGEQHSLALGERLHLLETIACSKIPKESEIIFGVAAIRLKDAITLSKKIAEEGDIAGVMLAFPPYIRPSQKEAIYYAETLIEQAQKSVILYNNPPRTGFDLSVESAIYLSQHPLVEGIKEAGNPDNISIFREKISKPFRYYVGGEVNLVPKLQQGFNGISSILGNLYPKEIQQILIDHLQRDLAALSQSEQVLDNLLKPFMEADNFLVALKNALNENGLEMGSCRSPLGQISK